MSVLSIREAAYGEVLGGKPIQMSPSFKKCAASKLTPKLKKRIEVSEDADSLCSSICLSAPKYSSYITYKNGISAMLFRVETLRPAFWFAECSVIWKSHEGQPIYAPWDDVLEDSIDMGLLMDKKNTDMLNFTLARLRKRSEKESALFALPFPFYMEPTKKYATLYLEVGGRVTAKMILELVGYLRKFAKTKEWAEAGILGLPRETNRHTIGIDFALYQPSVYCLYPFLEGISHASFSILRAKIEETPYAKRHTSQPLLYF